MTIPTGEYISRSQAPEVEPEIKGLTINDFVEMLQDVKPDEVIREINEYNIRNNTDIIPEEKAILIEYLNKFNDIENKENFSAVYNIDENFWKDVSSIQLKLKDLK